MQIDIFILFAQIINFLILYYVFQRFIAQKLNTNILKRREQLKKLETAEEHYKQKMSLAEQQKQEFIKQARQTSVVLMQESEKIAKEKAQKIIAKANRDTYAILEGARNEAKKERISMLSNVKKHILTSSLKLNEKMFGEQNINSEFLQQELELLEQK